ncbi:MAG: DUF481 domain-containing protein [Puniceicoccaceae bacterium]
MSDSPRDGVSAGSEAPSPWSYSPSGAVVFRLDELVGPELGPVAIRHRSFPASSLDSPRSPEDHRLGFDYRSRLSGRGFLQGQSFLDDGAFGPYAGGYRQVVGYGLRIVDRQTVTFEVVPGVAGNYSLDDPFIDERVRWMGNVNQNLSWEIKDGLVLNQNFNTILERTREEDLSAVLNLDLETLFSDQLSFKLSYEVHYDDSIGDEMEQRDARLSTSVGFRF